MPTPLTLREMGDEDDRAREAIPTQTQLTARAAGGERHQKRNGANLAAYQVQDLKSELGRHE